ncbi:hypothetical protein TSAR_000879 [Trichomalopsis sarcophagae]|uniref:Uncharacterized protein n=1 Tax=Trichomalopsis sarcophagae TaxID=543379 RepID=A0A232EK27_9HYME|nr:hypothetical protein TSAR_000879 [Trichomalopsis sarcophagae]
MGQPEFYTLPEAAVPVAEPALLVSTVFAPDFDMEADAALNESIDYFEGLFEEGRPVWD